MNHKKVNKQIFQQRSKNIYQTEISFRFKIDSIFSLDQGFVYVNNLKVSNNLRVSIDLKHGDIIVVMIKFE